MGTPGAIAIRRPLPADRRLPGDDPHRLSLPNPSSSMQDRYSLRFESGERKGETVPIPAGGCTVGAGLAGVPTLSLAALLALGSIVVGALATLPAHAVDWQDNSLTYTAGNRFTEPANRSPVRKDILEFVHASG